MNHAFSTDRAYAQELDSADPLAPVRDRFFIPPNCIYLDGNSLGLMAKEGHECLSRVVDEWKTRGVHGWMDVDRPWFHMAERIGAALASLIGADPKEVIATGATTINLHALVSTFYQPSGKRAKILADDLTFPSDIYALRSQIRMKGRDANAELRLVSSRDGLCLDERDVIQHMTDEVAVIVLPSVLYRSGQLLDMLTLTRAAHEKGIPIGFDCSHSIGVVPHRMDELDADFAFWCSYKYLNGGPGCPGFLYVNKRHFDREPGLAGWFGYEKAHQFDLAVDYRHDRSAGGWQISSPGILGMAPLEGSIDLLRDVGIEAVREKSLAMTSYFIRLLDPLFGDGANRLRLATPRRAEARGGHVAIESDHAPRVFRGLAERGVVGDLRPPNIIRLAPSPLYNTFDELWTVARHLRAILDELVAQ